MFWFLCVRPLVSALAAWHNHCHEKIPQTFYVMRYHNLPGTTIKWIRMAAHLTPSTGVQDIPVPVVYTVSFEHGSSFLTPSCSSSFKKYIQNVRHTVNVNMVNLFFFVPHVK